MLAEDVPSGSHEYISTRVFGSYVELLSMITGSAPGAKPLVGYAAADTGGGELKRRAVGDPLVRRTVEDGVGLYVPGRDAIDERSLNGLLAAAEEHARHRRTTLLAETPGCLGISSTPHHGDVRTGVAEGDDAADRFVEQRSGRLPVLRVE
ncbi:MULTISPECIES: hypothetical protein [unclassified Streptomyces]|uniref:hypothetical protein n=1 Tax=unclassified Streptomyces TaxID=2593676 RepID=UPI0033A535B8